MWLSQKKKKNLRTGLNDLGGVIGIPGRILEIMAEIFHIQRTSSSIDTKKKKIIKIKMLGHIIFKLK